MQGGWNKGLALANWDKRVKDKFGETFELVSIGEPGSKGERHITVRCSKCGTEKTVSSVSFRGRFGSQGHCVVCSIKETKVKNNNEQKAKKLKKELVAEKKRNKTLIQKKQIVFGFCKCGQLLSPGKRVCENCKAKPVYNHDAWRVQDVKRRARFRKVKHDSDISLSKLFERDQGICYICGRECNWNDSRWEKGIFKVGKTYPTIEHLIPISKGGDDTWENIKLACLSCNSKKGAKQLVDIPLGG